MNKKVWEEAWNKPHLKEMANSLLAKPQYIQFSKWTVNKSLAKSGMHQSNTLVIEEIWSEVAVWRLPRYLELYLPERQTLKSYLGLSIAWYTNKRLKVRTGRRSKKVTERVYYEVEETVQKIEIEDTEDLVNTFLDIKELLEKHEYLVFYLKNFRGFTSEQIRLKTGIPRRKVKEYYDSAERKLLDYFS